jgi:hypothetical protein
MLTTTRLPRERTHRSAARQARRTRRRHHAPLLEILESRQLLSIGVGGSSAGYWIQLEITCFDNDNHVVLSEDLTTQTLILTQTAPGEPGQVWTFDRNNYIRVKFRGGPGNDFFENDTSSSPTTTTIDVIAVAGAGNDTLIGGYGNDVLVGGSGNDLLEAGPGNGRVVLNAGTGDSTLIGGKGPDLLYGGPGRDSLVGGSYSNWFDAVGPNNIVVPGTGTIASGENVVNYDAQQPYVSGGLYDDVIQGELDDCGFMAALAAVAYCGADLAEQVTPQGPVINPISFAPYSVNSVIGTQSGVPLYFPGATLDPESPQWEVRSVQTGLLDPKAPLITAAEEARPDGSMWGEDWPLMYQSAYFDYINGHPTLDPLGTLANGTGFKPGFTFASTALTALTGNPTEHYLVANDITDSPQAQLARIQEAVYENRPIVAVVWGGTSGLYGGTTTPRLDTWHAYTVLGTDVDPQTGDEMIILRNPWGDNNGLTSWRTPDDGITQVTFQDFLASFFDYYIGTNSNFTGDILFDAQQFATGMDGQPDVISVQPDAAAPGFANLDFDGEFARHLPTTVRSITLRTEGDPTSYQIGAGLNIPITALAKANGLSLVPQYGYVLDSGGVQTFIGESLTVKLNETENDQVAISSTPDGGLSVNLDGQTSTFGAGVLTGIKVLLGSGNNAVTVQETGTGAVPVTITGLDGKDTINIEQTAQDNGWVTVNPGSGQTTVNVSPIAQNLGNIQGSISLTQPQTPTGGTTPGTLNLNIYDQSNTSGASYFLGVDGFIPNEAAPSTVIAWASLSGLNVYGASVNTNHYTVNGTPWMASTSLITSAPGDAFVVNGTDGPLTIMDVDGLGTTVKLGGGNKSLQGIYGSVDVTALAGQVALTADDSADTTAQPDVTINTTSIIGLAPADINFQTTALGSITITGGSGQNTYNIEGVAVPLSLSTGNGADTISVSPSAQDLTTIAAALSITGGTGPDDLTLNDQAYALQNVSIITTTEFESSHAAAITFSALAGLTFDTGSSADNLTDVESTAAGTPVTVQAGSGNDHVVISDIANDLSNIQGTVSVQGGGQTSLSIDDQADQGHATDTITTQSLTSSRSATFSFSGLSRLTSFMSSRAGAYTDIESTAATTPVEVDAGNVADSIAVCFDDADLTNIQGALTILGVPGQTHLTIDDFAYTLYAINTITSQGFSSHCAPITFSGLAALTFFTSGSADGFTDIESTAADTKTSVFAGNGYNSIGLSNTAENLDNLAGAVIVQGRGPSTSLSLNDLAAPVPYPYTLTASSLTRPNFGGLTYYAGVGTLTLFAAADSNSASPQATYVVSTAAGTATRIDAASSGWHNIFVGLPAVNALGAPGSPLEDILGAVTVIGRSQDNLTVDDSASTAQKTYTLNEDNISVAPAGGTASMPVSWQGSLSTVVLNGSSYISAGAALASDTYLLDSQASDLAALVVDGAWTTNTFESLLLSSHTWVVSPDEAASVATGTPDHLVILGEVWNVVGGPGGDDFRFVPNNGHDGALNGTLNGNGGTLDYSQDSSPVTVNLANLSAGNIDGGAASGFSNIQHLIGNNASTTLAGPNAITQWKITATNQGNLTPGPNPTGTFTFTGVPNLTGGPANDDFQFSNGAVVTGVIDGGGVSPRVGSGNTFDFSLYATGVTVDLQAGTASHTGGIRHIQNVIGTAGNDTIYGDGIAADTNTIVTNGGVDHIYGRAENDLVYLYGVQLAGTTIDGGGAGEFDAIIGGALAYTWNITGHNSGTVNGTRFTNMPNLYGGLAADTFAFYPGGRLDGSLVGNTGVNTINYSHHTAPVTVKLQDPSVSTGQSATGTGGIGYIQTFIGNTSSASTFQGLNQDATWQLSGSGSDRVVYGQTAYTFRSFANLTGGTGVDTFHFAPGATTGFIDGGGAPAGRGDWLDYSGYNAAVAVNLANGSATGVSNGVVRIQNVFGGNSGNTLTGDAQGNILVGSTGSDQITGGSGASLLIGASHNGTGPDQITGGTGDDILIAGYTDYDHNAAALMDILAEWQSSDSLALRLARIRQGVGSSNARLVWGARSHGGTVHDDGNGLADALRGDPATSSLTDQDWFFAGLAAEVLDFRNGEHLNNA